MISFPAEENILKWNIPDRNSKENNCKNKGADLNPLLLISLRVQMTLHTQHVIIMCSLFIVLHRWQKVELIQQEKQEILHRS